MCIRDSITTVKSEVDTMIDALVEKAQVALHKFLELDQEQVDHIVHEMAPVSYTHLN